MKKPVLWFLLSLLLVLSGCGQETGYPEDGLAQGELGDTMHSYFFDYTLHQATLQQEFQDLQPAQEGDAFWVADVEVKNTGKEPITMYDVDFRVEWGEDLYDAPITYYQEPVSKKQLPIEYELQGGESRRGLLVFEIPKETKEVALCYQEAFENGTEGGEPGDKFRVVVPVTAAEEE